MSEVRLDVVGEPTSEQIAALVAGKWVRDGRALSRLGAKCVRGWDREWIGIPSVNGGWKLWAIDARGNCRTANGKLVRRNYGPASVIVFADENQRGDRLFDVEGESDLLAAIESGLTCVITGTAGAGSLAGHDLHEDLLTAIQVKEAVIIRDLDPAGRKGAKAAALWWRAHGFPTRSVLLPDSLGRSGDLRDLLNGVPGEPWPEGAVDELDALVEGTELLDPVVGSAESPAPSQSGQQRDPSPWLTKRGKVESPVLAAELVGEGHVVPGIDGRLMRYVGGVYTDGGEAWLQQEVRNRLARRYRRCHQAEVIAYARATTERMRRDQMPDDLLNVANGLLHWKSRELAPHTPEVWSCCQLQVAWNPEARCPEIDRFLAAQVPEDAQGLVREVIGYGLLPGNPMRKAVLLLGPTGSGKSQLLRLIERLAGDGNISRVPLQRFAERFDLANTYGKLLNIFGDLDARAIRATDTFKAMTGNDTVYGERKHQDAFSFQPTALPIFSANQVPGSTDRTDAYFDRWLVVPMQVQVAQPERIADLAEKLADTPGELEGLLLQAVDGLCRLMQRGHFETPDSVREAGREYREDVDPVAAFIEAECILHPEAFIERKRLWEWYLAWTSAEHRERVLERRKFYEHMRSAFKPEIRQVKLHGTWGFRGIVTRNPGDGHDA